MGLARHADELVDRHRQAILLALTRTGELPCAPQVSAPRGSIWASREPIPRPTVSHRGEEPMRKIAILVVLALVAVPAALAEDSTQADQPSALCKQQRGRDRRIAAFKLLYGATTPTAAASRSSRAPQRPTRRTRRSSARPSAPTRRSPTHPRRQDVRAVLRHRQERPQRLRQVRLRARRRRSTQEQQQATINAAKDVQDRARRRWAPASSRRSTAAGRTHSGNASRRSRTNP